MCALYSRTVYLQFVDYGPDMDPSPDRPDRVGPLKLRKSSLSEPRWARYERYCLAHSEQLHKYREECPWNSRKSSPTNMVTAAPFLCTTYVCTYLRCSLQNKQAKPRRRRARILNPNKQTSRENAERPPLLRIFTCDVYVLRRHECMSRH